MISDSQHKGKWEGLNHVVWIVIQLTLCVVLGLTGDSSSYAQSAISPAPGLEEQALLRAVEQARADPTEDRKTVLQALTRLANFYRGSERESEEARAWEEIIPLVEAEYGPWHEALRESLDRRAFLYRIRGRHVEALPLLQRSLSIREKTLGPFALDVAERLNDLANINFAMERNLEALPFLERSLAIVEKAMGPDHPDVAARLYSLGVILHEVFDRHAEALLLQQRSLTIREKALGAEHPEVAIGLHNLARLHVSMGRYAEALLLFQRSLDIREKALSPDRLSIADTLNDLASLYRSMGRPATETLTLLHQAEFLAAPAGATYPLSLIQGALADTYAALDQLDESILWGKQAVNTLQAFRSVLGKWNMDQERRFLEDKRDVYTALADRLISQGRIPEAQGVMAMLREEEFFDFVQRDARADTRTRSVPLTGVEAVAHKRFYEIRERLAEISRQRAVFQQRLRRGDTLTAAEQGLLVKLDADLRAATAAFDDFRAGLGKLLAGEKGGAERAGLTLKQVAASRDLVADLAMAGQGVAAVQYVVSERQVHVIVTTPGLQVAQQIAIPEGKLNTLGRWFREAVQNPNRDARPLARELYALLIGPIEATLRAQKIDTLMLMLDGSLRYLPFAALQDSDGAWLVERYRLALYTEAARTRLTQAPLGKWTMAGFGVTQAFPKLNFEALPSVKAELAGIAAVLPGQSRLDGAFTRQALEKALSTPVVHIASHFRFQAGSDASFLLLGDGSALTLRDVREGIRFQGVDLLTLSACDTAMGGGLRENGQEVEGLAVLAQNQGARAVLATLWAVADQSTAQLMQDFYRQRDAGKRNKAEALRAAQLAMLRGGKAPALAAPPPAAAADSTRALRREPTDAQSTAPRFTPDPARPFAHPYYWAPFILMGNWL